MCEGSYFHRERLEVDIDQLPGRQYIFSVAMLVPLPGEEVPPVGH